ncbi:MAG: hypothetical protein V7638_427 [Acidobacteriota bacterium]|jgi:transposase-like protein
MGFQPSCPDCLRPFRQIKFGRNRTNSQRYKCTHCGRVYTPTRKQKYSIDTQTKAVELFKYVGMSCSEIAGILGVSRQLIMYWIKRDDEARRSEKI